MVYASSSVSLAVLESFVHFSTSILPLDYAHVAVEVPDDLPVETWDAASLPAGWDEEPLPSANQELGREWIASRRTALLRVPSVVVPSELNVLVNPLHPDATRLVARPWTAFRFDSRMDKAIAAPRPRRKRAR